MKKREREHKKSESSYLKVVPLLRRADDIDKLACILVCQADSPKPQITKDFSPMMLQIPLNIAYKKLQ